MSLVYFINDAREIVCFDGETSVSVSQTNDVASSSVISSRNIADDVHEGDIIINISGLVTYTKTLTQLNNKNPNPQEIIRRISEVIASRSRFTLYATDSRYPLINSYDDCVIASWSYALDESEDTIEVEITFQQKFVSKSAKKSYLPPSPSKSTDGALASKGNGGDTGKTQVEEKQRTTIAYQIGGVWKEGMDKKQLEGYE